MVRSWRRVALAFGAEDTEPRAARIRMQEALEVERKYNAFLRHIAKEPALAEFASQMDPPIDAETLALVRRSVEWLESVGPHDTEKMSPEEVFRSVEFTWMLREDLESAPDRLRRVEILSAFGVQGKVSNRGRGFLDRVGRMYVAGHFPEATIIAASAIEQEVERVLDDRGIERLEEPQLGWLLKTALSRRLLSKGAHEAAWRIKVLRDDMLHVVMDAAIPEERMQKVLRDLSHVLSELAH